MLVIGLIPGVIGARFFCWLLFALAVYAPSVLSGLTAGVVAYHGGAGDVVSIVLALLAGGAGLAIGQIAFASARTPLVRGGRHPLCRAGRHSRLPRELGARAPRHPVRGLARGLRCCRRRVRRRRGLGSPGTVHPDDGRTGR